MTYLLMIEQWQFIIHPLTWQPGLFTRWLWPSLCSASMEKCLSYYQSLW